MKKGRLITTIIVLTVAAAALIFTVFVGTGTDLDKLKSDISNSFSGSGVGFGKLKATDINTKTPIMQTDFSDIFYTIDTEKGNAVSFYRYDDNKLSPVEPTGTVPVSVTYSGQTLTANVSYILRDGKITGYGLYTQSGVYNYAFFKLKTLPTSHQIDENEYLLLIDTDADNFYEKNKSYDISFYYSLADGKTSNFVYDVNATVGLDGKISDTYAMFTDEAIESAKNMIPFFTSRYYASSSLDKKFDVDIDNKERAAITRLVRKAHYKYARVTDDGTVFLRKTKTGFNSILIPSLNADEIVIKSFTGDYETNYIRYGDYVINKETCVVTNLITGESMQAESRDIVTVKYLAVSTDGTKAVIAGEKADGEQMIFFKDFSAGSAKKISGKNLFTSANANFSFIGSEAVFYNKPSSDSGNVYNGCIAQWTKIF